MSENIFSFVSRDKISAMLHSFYECIGVPVQLLDENSKDLLHFGSVNEFCTLFTQKVLQKETCADSYIRAGQMAKNFGGSYTFTCEAGLNNIIHPISIKNKVIAIVLVGPFFFDSPENLSEKDFTGIKELSDNTLIELNRTAKNMPVVTPRQSRNFSNLLEFLLNGVIVDYSLENAKIQETFYQQSRINEAIQTYKTFENAVPENYPHELEKKLILKIKTGDTFSARNILNELLGYVFFAEGNSLDAIKYRSIELSSVLSRATIDCGAPTEMILSINKQYQISLPTLNNLDSVCYELQNLVDAFIDSLFYTSNSEYNEYVKKAVAYIAKHYFEKITLDDVSFHVNVSSAYFSSIFKKITKLSFTQYLNTVRIEESKYLLLNTDYSIMNIALSVGYDDQGYYTKVFKKITSVSPGEYKKWHTMINTNKK